MRWRHAFIVTYGRTGSTLLTALLNPSGRATIFGENSDYLYSLYQALRNLDRWQGFSAGAARDQVRHPFFGAETYDFAAAREALLAELKGFFRRYRETDPDHLLGFKEIGYLVSDLQDYLDFLTETFDRTFLIFLTRDAQSVARSGFYKSYSDEAVGAAIAVADAEFATYAASHPDSTFRLDYEDLVGRSPALHDLLDRLGLDIPDAEIDSVLATPTSYDRKSFVEIRPGLTMAVDQERLARDGILFRPLNTPRRADLVEDWGLAGLVMAMDGDPLEAVILRGGGTPVPAEIGIPSHGLAKEMPDRPQAANARFRFVGAAVSGSDRLELSARFRSRGEVLLARLILIRP